MDRFVRDELRRVPQLRVPDALWMEKPAHVYWSLLENGRPYMIAVK